MNDRIKELAKQCYESGPLGKDGWPEYTKFKEQKFAELIVQETLNVALYGDEHAQARTNVKTLFGVEND